MPHAIWKGAIAFGLVHVPVSLYPTSQENGDYVLLSDDEVRKAYPKTTQTIEIEAFVKQSEVSFVSHEKPYYLKPAGKGEKVYALLREGMGASNVVDLAMLVDSFFLIDPRRQFRGIPDAIG